MKGGTLGDHTVGGPCLSVSDTTRWFFVRCRCGWQSEGFATAVLAEAAGEQHALLGRKRQSPRRRTPAKW